MAGIIRGRIDCKFNTLSGPRNMQEYFRTLWAFLDSHPNLTRIASNYGNVAAGNVAPPTNVRGIGYWNESVNLNHRAFGVWRWNSALWPWYLFVELDTNDGGRDAIPQLDGYWPWGVAIQAAWGVSSGGLPASPWNGGTANAGADARGTPRWAAPAGGSMLIMPRGNDTSGSYATNKQASFPVAAQYYSGTPPTCAHFIADDDTLIIATDYGDDNTWRVSYLGRFMPRIGYTISRPYVLLGQGGQEGSQVPWPAFSTTFGTIGANDINREGGIIPPESASGNNVRAAFIERLANVHQNANFNPGNALGTPYYDEWEALVGAYETGATPSVLTGVLGKLDPAMYREVYNVGSSDTDSTLSRVFLGGSTALANIKASIPWDGVTSPRTYANGRLGVSF